MAGLGPAIHVFPANGNEKTWMAGPSPAMTLWVAMTESWYETLT